MTWINPAGGGWDTASNWRSGQVPGAAGDAVIDLSGVTVTHSAAAGGPVIVAAARLDFGGMAGLGDALRIEEAPP